MKNKKKMPKADKESKKKHTQKRKKAQNSEMHATIRDRTRLR